MRCGKLASASLGKDTPAIFPKGTCQQCMSVKSIRRGYCAKGPGLGHFAPCQIQTSTVTIHSRPLLTAWCCKVSSGSRDKTTSLVVGCSLPANLSTCQPVNLSVLEVIYSYPNDFLLTLQAVGTHATLQFRAHDSQSGAVRCAQRYPWGVLHIHVSVGHKRAVSSQTHGLSNDGVDGGCGPWSLRPMLPMYGPVRRRAGTLTFHVSHHVDQPLGTWDRCKQLHGSSTSMHVLVSVCTTT